MTTMRFDTSQHMRLGQQMKLAPRMIQSMEILQMPLAELEERLEQELESNPTLELAEGDAEESEVRAAVEERRREDREIDRPLDVEEGAGTEDFERLDSFSEQNPEALENALESPDRLSSGSEAEFERYRTSAGSGDRDAKLDAMAAAPARSASLVDQLRGQWALADVDGALRPLGELVISFLDDDGYLRTGLDVIADRAPVGTADPRSGVLGARPTGAELERALQAVQLLLEPAGIAARTPSECLLLQLDALEDDAEELGWPRAAVANARTLVREHLDDLMQNRLPRVSEKTGMTLVEIKEALTLLRRLSLAPGRRLVEETTRPIVPDAIVEYDNEQDRYIAYLNDTALPNLRINQEYARLSKDKALEKKDRLFLKTNLGNAQWLLEAVHQRRHTLLRVVRAVVEAQRDFFDFGPQALRPLPMTTVADQLGIHVATVSRAVAEKHLATPRGVVPLRKFFSGGLQLGEGEEVAWDAIKVALREVIEGENKRKPLSDESLVDELKKRGIEIARRTVAKYRDQLGIQPARLRKQFE